MQFVIYDDVRIKEHMFTTLMCSDTEAP